MEQVVAPNIFVIGVYLFGVIGFVLTFRESHLKRLQSNSIAIAGLVLLIIFMFSAQYKIKKEGEGLFQVAAGIGYYISFLAFATVLFFRSIVRTIANRIKTNIKTSTT